MSLTVFTISKDTEVRKSKKRRASDIGIKEIFTNKRNLSRSKNGENNLKIKNVSKENKRTLQDVLSSKGNLKIHRKMHFCFLLY